MDAKVLIPDLANAVAQRKRIPANEAEAFIKQFLDLVNERIVSDRLLKIKGLGTFKIIDVQERESINVNNGERIVIPGHMKVAFTPDAQLKNQVNRPFSAFQTVMLNENTPLEEMERLDADTMSFSQAEFDEDTDGEITPDTVTLADSDEIVSSTDEMDDSVPTDVDKPANSGKNLPNEAIPAANVEAKDAESDTLPHEMEDSLPDAHPVPSDESGNSGPVDKVDKVIHSEPQVASQPQEVVPAAVAQTIVSQPAGHSIARRVACIIGILLLMAGCYVAGYYRIPDFKQLAYAFVPKPEVVKVANEPQTETDATDISEPEPEETAEERAMREAVDLYPQVPGGKYLIIGTKGVRQMKRGDTLLKMARQEYGHPDFAQYIIVFNQFADPDVIPLGSEVRLPQLVEQTQAE